MKCYHCGQNEADHRFLVNYMGQMGEVHLCRECLGLFAGQAGAMYREYRRQNQEDGDFRALFTPAREESAGEPADSTNPFPADAGEAVHHRRNLNALRAQLQEAVCAERYEKAAKLRDQIANMEKDVYFYDA